MIFLVFVFFLVLACSRGNWEEGLSVPELHSGISSKVFIFVGCWLFVWLQRGNCEGKVSGLFDITETVVFSLPLFCICIQRAFKHVKWK